MPAPPSGIALFGYYRSAVEVASYLRTGDYRLVIIDDNPENLEKARSAGYETARLDFRNDSELAKLGLGESIDTIFCLFPDDAENVFLTLAARALAPGIRIFSIAHGRSSVPNLRAAGANKVIETEEISGLRIWDIITRPIVTAILDHTLFGQANLNVTELPIPPARRLSAGWLRSSNLKAGTTSSCWARWIAKWKSTLSTASRCRTPGFRPAIYSW